MSDELQDNIGRQIWDRLAEKHLEWILPEDIETVISEVRLVVGPVVVELRRELDALHERLSTAKREIDSELEDALGGRWDGLAFAAGLVDELLKPADGDPS